MKQRGRTSKKQKSVLVGVLVLALVTLAGLAVVAMVATKQSKSLPPAQASVLNLRGEIVCIPKKNIEQPKTDECVFGLKVTRDADVYYRLTNVSRSVARDAVSTGANVLVTGALEPPVRNEPYLSAGTVEISSIRVFR